MKIKLMMTGKTQEKYITDGFDLYKKRIVHYIPFEEVVIPTLRDTKNMKDEEVKQKEGELILRNLRTEDYVVLLDERGKQFNSIEFSGFIQQRMNVATKTLTFLIGGAFGVTDEVYTRADNKLSLSTMTFSHQIIRLIFMEQLYRAFSIMRNEPYHK
jgi:23S rRNA (pseudouridine1915-N3)-methyltransferase